MPDAAVDLLHGALLYLDGVSVSCDGFRALNALSLVIAPGELRTIIGPNGAGKTTMMDVITGKTRPDEGQALFHGGVDLTRLDEAAIANLGIGRKFQKPTVFENLTVFDNLELALKTKRDIWRTLLARLSAKERDRIESVLATIGLEAQRTTRASALSHGQQQWLEIGMLLVQDTQLLLLDEPVAGMTDNETAKTALLIREIAGGDYAQMAEALNDEITVELATKSDLRALEAALNGEFAEVRTEIVELRTELRTEIAELRTELRTDIADVRTELRTEIAAVRTEAAATAGRLEARLESMSGEIVKWVGGMMLVQLVAMLGLVRILFVE